MVFMDVRMLKRAFPSAIVVVASLAACAPRKHQTPAASSNVVVSGQSPIEGRYVYAPPEEGEFTVPLTLDIGLPGEFSIQEPSMVSGSATVHVVYSKSHGTVDFEIEAHGLPYRPTFTKSFDDSTPFNPQLTGVKEARWQLWLAGTMFGRQHEDLYYSAGTPRSFLGTRYDFAPLGARPPPWPGGVARIQGNARQMIGSPLFDPLPNGELRFRFSLPYDHMVDRWGTPGSLNLLLPLDGCEPDTMSNYWTQSRLPEDSLMTWDTFLQSIWSGEGIGFAMTAEPVARPEWLGFRSSTFVGWSNVYPGSVPDGFGLDFCTFGTVIPIHERSYQLAPWPPTSRRNLCRSRT